MTNQTSYIYQVHEFFFIYWHTQLTRNVLFQTMAQRKPYIELSKKRQSMRINERLKAEFEEEYTSLDNASTKKKSKHEEDATAQNLSVQDNNVVQQDYSEKINDIPLFGKIFSEEYTSKRSDTNNVDNYLSEIMYQKFCQNFGIIDDMKNQQPFEAQGLWSNSDTEDEDDFEDELKDLVKDMKRDDLTRLLKLLHKMGHEDLPDSAEQLRNTPKETKISKCEEGEYFHYGLKQCLTDIIEREQILPAVIELDIGCDGPPATKSGKRKLWPVTGRISNDRSISPFLIGCYHGTKEPSSSIHYLSPFANEFEQLKKDPIKIRGKEYKIVLRNVICDTPARCLVTGTQLYNGYYGCCKCEVKGIWPKNKMLFLEEDAPLRTNESFRQRRQPQHHKETSPLEKLPIDMIKSFPLDYMHLVCLGVVKLLLKLWFRSNKSLFSAKATALLSEILENLAKYVPREFSRKTQSLSDLGRWKATQLRFFCYMLDQSFYKTNCQIKFSVISIY